LRHLGCGAKCAFWRDSSGDRQYGQGRANAGTGHGDAAHEYRDTADRLRDTTDRGYHAADRHRDSTDRGYHTAEFTVQRSGLELNQTRHSGHQHSTFYGEPQYDERPWNQPEWFTLRKLAGYGRNAGIFHAEPRVVEFKFVALNFWRQPK
jgi:hypothetical protein